MSFGFEGLGHSSMEGLGSRLLEQLRDVNWNEIIPTSEILDQNYENSILGRRALETPIVDTFEQIGRSPLDRVLEDVDKFLEESRRQPANIVTETITPHYEMTEKIRTVDKNALKERVTKKHELATKRKSAFNPEYDLEGLKKEVSEIKPNKTRRVKKSTIKKAVDKKQAQQAKKAGAETLAKVKEASTGNITVKINDAKSPELEQMSRYYQKLEAQQTLAKIKEASTGNISVNVTNSKSPELTKMADFYRNQAKTAQKQAKKQAIAAAKKSSTGNISIKVNDFKSPELAKLADYYKGQEALANVKAASTGNITVNVTNRKSPELTKMADFYKNQAKTAQKRAAKQALADVKKASTGNISVKINDGKSTELQKMAEYYKNLEANSNKGVIGFLKKNKKTAIIATAALAVIGLTAYIMHKNSAKANKTA